ncbi:MAG: TetR/AcrR family transcriptional regulator C-terminal domain-containing protein [Clostridiales bacterium]|nr:TetR/AcrR family transcriptional regulator C-terminal domain-containing protein [Clostridiales bacterium]
MEKENQRVMLTKRLLKESIMRLLQNKNIQAISVKELCEDSGINRSTFYKHYGRPCDVLEELENEIIESIPVVPIKDLREKGNDRKVFIKHTTDIIEYVRDNKDFAALLRLNGDIISEFAMKAFNFPAIKSIIEDAIPDSYDETDRYLIFKFFQSGFYSMVREWLVSGSQKSIDDMAQLLTDMIEIIFKLQK